MPVRALFNSLKKKAEEKQNKFWTDSPQAKILVGAQKVGGELNRKLGRVSESLYQPYSEAMKGGVDLGVGFTEKVIGQPIEAAVMRRMAKESPEGLAQYQPQYAKGTTTKQQLGDVAVGSAQGFLVGSYATRPGSAGMLQSLPLATRVAAYNAPKASIKMAGMLAGLSGAIGAGLATPEEGGEKLTKEDRLRIAKDEAVGSLREGVKRAPVYAAGSAAVGGMFPSLADAVGTKGFLARAGTYGTGNVIEDVLLEKAGVVEPQDFTDYLVSFLAPGALEGGGKVLKTAINNPATRAIGRQAVKSLENMSDDMILQRALNDGIIAVRGGRGDEKVFVLDGEAYTKKDVLSAIRRKAAQAQEIVDLKKENLPKAQRTLEVTDQIQARVANGTATQQDLNFLRRNLESLENYRKSGILKSNESAAGEQPLDPIVDAAKRYKSAEEFVEAQSRGGDNTYYHGTTKKGADNIDKVGFIKTEGGFNKGRGISVSKEYAVANEFASGGVFGKSQAGGGDVFRVEVDPRANIVDMQDFLDLRNELKEGIVLTPPDIKAEKARLGVSKLSMAEETRLKFKMANDAAYKEFGSRGVDIIDASKRPFTVGQEQAESIILNPNVIKNKNRVGTKSQLTEIWNKANRTVEPQEAAMGVGAMAGVGKSNILRDMYSDSVPKSNKIKIKQPDDVAKAVGSILPEGVTKGLQDTLDGVKTPKINVSGGKDTIKATDTPAVKEKKLFERMKQAVPEDVAENLKGVYKPITNKETIAEAQAIIKKNLKNAEQRALNPQNATDQAIGMELFGQYVAKGDIGKANAVLNAVSGTKEGQMIQILSQYGLKSPEGMVKYAMDLINRYNKTAKKEIKLTKAQIKDFYKQAKAIDAMPEGRAKNLELTKLKNQVDRLIPSTIGDKLITIWKAGLLTSPRTTMRNILGNSLNLGFEVVKDIPASFFDKLASLKTGERTIKFTARGMRGGAAEGTARGMDMMRYGVDLNDDISKYDYRKVNWGNNPIEQGFKKYTDLVFNSLGAQDKPFWNAEFRRSMWSQALAIAENEGKSADANFVKNLVDNPTTSMLATATTDANRVTFKNKNVGSQAIAKFKTALKGNEFTKFLGDFVLPFTGVPTSIAGQILDYSPVGFVRGAINYGRVFASEVPGLQRQASQELARGTMGVGLFGLGAYLMSEGLMTGQPKDAKEAELWRMEGKQGNSVFINGKWRNINSIGPQPLILLAGGKATELGRGESSVGEFGASLVKDYTDQTFLAGVQQPLQAVSDPARYGQSYLQSTASSFVPNIVADTSKALDPNMRETDGVAQAVQSRIPIARNQLPIRRDVFGQPVAQEPTGAMAYVDLFNSRAPKSNDVVSELTRLNELGLNATPSRLTKNQTIAGEKKEMSKAELSDLNAKMGPEVENAIRKLIETPEYQQLADEDKKDAISKITTSTRKIVRATGGETPVMGDGTFILVDPETGSVKTIDITKPIDYPNLTGRDDVNKKLISNYKSAVNKRRNDIIELFTKGKISEEEAGALLDVLDMEHGGTGSGGSARKLKLSAPARINFGQPQRQQASPIRITGGGQGFRLSGGGNQGFRLSDVSQPQRQPIRIARTPDIKLSNLKV